MPLHIPHLEGVGVNAASGPLDQGIMAVRNSFHCMYSVREGMNVQAEVRNSSRVSFISAAIVRKSWMFSWGCGRPSMSSLSEEPVGRDAVGISVSEGAFACEWLRREDAMFPRLERNISGMLWPGPLDSSRGEREQEAEEFRKAVPI